MWHYWAIGSGYGAIALTIHDQRLQEGIQRMKDTGIHYMPIPEDAGTQRLMPNPQSLLICLPQLVNKLIELLLGC